MKNLNRYWEEAGKIFDRDIVVDVNEMLLVPLNKCEAKSQVKKQSASKHFCQNFSLIEVYAAWFMRQLWVKKDIEVKMGL